MKGVWLENGKFSVRSDLPVPKTENEVLIKVVRAGICKTDIELSKGYYPYTGIVGHEFVGIVENQENVSNNLIGKTVVGEINCVCHDCYFCMRNIRNHCQKRTVLGIINRDGCMAQYLTLPAENLYIVPDNVPIKRAVFAEPLAAALEIQEQIKITSEDRVLVIGDGKLGLLISQTLAITKCRLTVLGEHLDKLNLLNKFDIKSTTSSKEILPDSFDIVVECSGNPVAFEIAVML